MDGIAQEVIARAAAGELPWVSPEKLKEQLRGMVDGLAEEIMGSLNTARKGELINDSEEPVRQAGHEFIRAAFEAAVQHKLDALEASFSPSRDHCRRSGDQAAANEAIGE